VRPSISRSVSSSMKLAAAAIASRMESTSLTLLWLRNS
jgi:hypothetical protein